MAELKNLFSELLWWTWSIPFKALAKGWADERAAKEALMEDVCDKRQAGVLPFTTVSLRTAS